MLHPGIAKAFRAKRSEALEEQGLAVAAISEDDPGATLSIPTLAEVSAADFLDNRRLHQEVFGPFTILVICRDLQEMVAVAGSFEGQLTTTVWATESEALSENKLLDLLESRCGRMIMNGVPTGVAVSTAMHHGGPYPATTDSRFTAVGADGIKRFARPVCYQNWLNALLPDELRNENPLGLWRMVNNELTKKTIGS